MAATRTRLPPLPTWARGKVAEIFGADLRALATFRIVLAVVVLADLAIRATDLSAHYGDAGILPRSLLMTKVHPWLLSLNTMGGAVLFQAVLFGVAALAALALLVGYRTRPMSIVVWVMLLSIQGRNPFVHSSADTLLRLLLFWAMFLPLGSYWSVDRRRVAAPVPLSTRFFSMATVGLFLQIAFVYWFTAILKSGREWRVDFTAISYALSAEQFVTPLGASLQQFPELLKVMTIATILLEAFGPFLLFCPVRTGPVRTMAVLSFMGLHFGIWLTMDIDMFPWISGLCMVCFLPGWFWDTALPKLRTALPTGASLGRRPRRSVGGAVHPHWATLRAWFAGLSSGRLSTAGMSPDVFAHPARSYAAHLSERLPPPWFSPTGAAPTMLRSSLLSNLLAFVFLVYVLLWNLTTVSDFAMPQHARTLGYLLGLRQQWSMFAPRPTTTTSWLVIPGTLRDGRQVDLFEAIVYRDPSRAKEVSWERPPSIADRYKNHHWRKYLAAADGDRDMFLYFGRYVCRTWNGLHAGPSEVTTFEVVSVEEKTLLDDRGMPAPSPQQRDRHWTHRCG